MSIYIKGLVATLMLLSFFSSAQAEVEIKKMPQEAVIFEPQCEIIISQSVTISNARQAEDMMNGKVTIEIMTGAKKDIYNVDRKMHYTVTAPLHWETGTISRYDELGNMVYISQFSNEEKDCETGNVTAEMQWVSKRKTSLIVKTSPEVAYYEGQTVWFYFQDGTRTKENISNNAMGYISTDREDWDLLNPLQMVEFQDEWGEIVVLDVISMNINTFATSPKTIVLGTESKVYDFSRGFSIDSYLLPNETKTFIGRLNGNTIFNFRGFDLVVFFKGKRLDFDFFEDRGESIPIYSEGLTKIEVKGHNGKEGNYVFYSEGIIDIKVQLDGLLGDLVPPSRPIQSLPTM